MNAPTVRYENLVVNSVCYAKVEWNLLKTKTVVGFWFNSLGPAKVRMGWLYY